MTDEPCTLEQARSAKSKAIEVFGLLAPVVGVGITRAGEGYALKVNLEREPQTQPPAEVDGVPVRVEVVGPISPRRSCQP